LRYEGKTLEEALEQASAALGRPADDLQYRIVEDRKSFWGGRKVLIELITDGTVAIPARAAEEEPTEDPEGAAEAERALGELLDAAHLDVAVRRLESGVSFELSGIDVKRLLARRGEGLEGLQTLAGRIAGKRLGRPVYVRLDAEGFREHRREMLTDLANRSAERVKRSGRKILLDPMAPSERRMIHLALASDSDVETRSEGEGFFKRVAILPRR
jgi:spoIIIJ-associated protein